MNTSDTAASNAACSSEVPAIRSVWDQVLLTTKEVCEIMRIDRVTLRQLEKTGRFPKALRHMGKRIFWRTVDVQEFLKDPEGWPAKNGKMP